MALQPHHKRVLLALEETSGPGCEWYSSFKTIATAARMSDEREVRRIVRHLARKGLAQYAKGLTSDDGLTFGGAGYCITDAGVRELADNPIDSVCERRTR